MLPDIVFDRDRAYMPAIMKGYIDRVLSFNFIYQFESYELILRLSVNEDARSPPRP